LFSSDRGEEGILYPITLLCLVCGNHVLYNIGANVKLNGQNIPAEAARFQLGFTRKLGYLLPSVRLGGVRSPRSTSLSMDLARV
jgi:hypothetical protein